MMNNLFVLLQKILPQHLLSRIAGRATTADWSTRLIQPFIKKFQVDMSEALDDDPMSYANFHQFFTRQLRPEVRADSRAAFISPCDGTFADIGRITDGIMLQAKKHRYSLTELTADDNFQSLFSNGWYTIIYLSPRDYHRVHTPCDCKLVRWRYLPGKLYSVNVTTAQKIPGLYAKNERLVCHFKSDIGEFLLIMVGAMLVSGIVTQWLGKHALATDSGWQTVDIDWNRYAEIGQFCFGSTVILITEQSFAGWAENLSENQAIRLGQALV